jgi:hypothetical protein
VFRRQLYALTGVLFLTGSFGLTAYLAATARPGVTYDPSGLLALAGAAAGFLLLLLQSSRFEVIAQYLVTYFHELGHGVAVALCGGTPEHFVLRLDASGYLTHRTRDRVVTRSIIAFSGYPFPAVVAFCGAALHVAGYGYLWILAVAFSAAGIALLAARNLWAFLAALTLSALAGYAHLTGSPSVLAVVLGFTVGILLRGGYESAAAHVALSRTGTGDRSDGEELARLLPGDALLWSRTQLAVIAVVTLLSFAVLAGGAAGVLVPPFAG